MKTARSKLLEELYYQAENNGTYQKIFRAGELKSAQAGLANPSIVFQGLLKKPRARVPHISRLTTR